MTAAVVKPAIAPTMGPPRRNPVTPLATPTDTEAMKETRKQTTVAVGVASGKVRIGGNFHAVQGDGGAVFIAVKAGAVEIVFTRVGRVHN